MAKRFTTVFFITLAIAVLCTAVFTLVLFMAPGMSVFGLKYIATDTHVVSEKFKISDALNEKYGSGDFSGSIRVEVEDVPVNVVFTQGWHYEIIYYDNYSGLTDSTFDDPSIEVSKDSDGTAVISVTSFKKFIFENANSKRYIKVMIPAVLVGSTNAGQTDFTVKANTSNVTFADEKTDNYDPYFHHINIETAGKVNCSLNLKADIYSLTTMNSINIGKDTKAAINATNYVLKSTGGNIVVERPVDGNIEATTTNSSIKILSCENFTSNSGWGDVSCSNPEKDIVINGKANITTTAGIVTIGSIKGETEVSYITTKTGLVNVKKAYDLEVSTTRGHVKVNSARNIKTTTSSGSITLEESIESANLTTKRGKVVVGGESAIVNDLTVNSVYGKVFINSASGKVFVETLKADVEFVNKDSEDVTLKVGGNLNAEGLVGAVNVTVDGAATLSFDRFTQDSVVTGNSSSTITIKLYNTKKGEFVYSLKALEVQVLKYNPEDPSDVSNLEVPGSSVTSENIVGPKLTATNTGKIVVYCRNKDN